jgi:signal transduction histidine kinase
MREFGRSIMLRRLSGEEIPSVGYRFIRKDGTEFWGETSARVLRDSGGSINGYIAIARDTTDRKQAEEKLRVSHERMRSLAARIEHVREEERTGLARELHDELGQGLTALQIDLAWLDGRLQTACAADLPGLRDKIAAMVPRAERLIETTQAISSSMRPGILDDLGLVAAIEWLAADFEKRTGLTCVATLPTTDITLDLALAVALFRIVQEALTNVVRHAHARHASVRILKIPDAVRLEICDDGKSFPVERMLEARLGGHLGLVGMRERVEMLGGRFAVESAPGKGTTVIAEIPFGSAGKSDRPEE